jgi:nicotinamide-nucleotide amidase
MAINGKEILQVDYCISITGNAGPATNEGKEEVGIVWISIASSDRVLSKRFNFENDRSRNIKRAVLSAMNFLRCELMKINM